MITKFKKNIVEKGKEYVLLDVYIDNNFLYRKWHYNNLVHREEGPAFESVNGMRWFWHGKIHREDGPAVIYSTGTKYWYKHGKIHREDGPALITKKHINFGREFHWFLNGVELSKYMFLQVQKDKIINLNGILYLKNGRKIQKVK